MKKNEKSPFSWILKVVLIQITYTKHYRIMMFWIDNSFEIIYDTCRPSLKIQFLSTDKNMIEEEQDKNDRILKSLWYVHVLFNKFKLCSNDCVFWNILRRFYWKSWHVKVYLKHVMWTLALQKATKFYCISKLTCPM